VVKMTHWLFQCNIFFITYELANELGCYITQS
jgi:hypothetical protein